MLSQPAFDFVVNCRRFYFNRVHPLAIRMEDDGSSGTLDVDRLAVVAVPAAVGDDQISLLLALPDGLEVSERLFELAKLARHALQLRATGGAYFLLCRRVRPAGGQLTL